MAYKLFSRNQPLSDTVALAAMGHKFGQAAANAGNTGQNTGAIRSPTTGSFYLLLSSS